jgi:hypothetical protein
VESDDDGGAGHTSRFLIIWLAFLPLALYPTWDWATVPVTTIIAFLLLGIDEIGVQIEEPFAILPLGAPHPDPTPPPPPPTANKHTHTVPALCLPVFNSNSAADNNFFPVRTK